MRSEKSAGGCGAFGYYMKNILKFLLSHIGLVSLVVGYTIIGAFIFERLESEAELEVKKNVTATRNKVTDDLWGITKDSLYFKEHLWADKVRQRLKNFETDLVRAMKKSGWDGNEELSTQQWTFAGALFYSIILITTIGYGHIAPKTQMGKVVTIFYAIPGVPLMMLCLANIGDGMAQSFRFLYWKVCCYACTKRPRRKRRGRISRISSRRIHEDSLDQPTEQRRPKVRDEPTRSSLKTRGVASEPSPNMRSSQRSIRSGDHLEIPNNEEAEDGRSAVLYNKYALEKEGIFPEDIPTVHDLGKGSGGNNPVSDSISNYRLDHRNDNDIDVDVERHREGRMREPEIFVTRAPRSAPGSLRGPSRSVYPESPITPHRESNYYSSTRHLPPNDPRSRLSRLEEEYYYDDCYVDDDDYEDDNDFDDENIDRPVPIWLGVMLVVAYIFGGAFLFRGWEGWNFLDSVYFCFITLTTIGFGDFVPAQDTKENAELSIALCSIYLLFGIALLAMSFNLVQEEVISNVKKVAKRLGIIKEEEDDGEE